MSGKLLFALALPMSLAAVGIGGEKVAKIKRLPLVAPGKDEAKAKARLRASFPVKVKAPFDTLLSAKYSRHLTALTVLVERGHKLSSAAVVEAKRLDALPPHKNKGVQEVLDSVIVSLGTLRAETSLMAKWKKGFSPAAKKVSGRKVDLTCQNLAVGKLLERAGKGWGVKIELSPLATRLEQTLYLDLAGAPTLTQFISWLCGKRSLTCGHTGDKLVLVPACSVKLKKALAAGEGGKSKAKRSK